MNHEVSLIKSHSYLKIFVQQFKVDNPIASVLLVHGLGEHADRYLTFIKELNDVNIAVFTMDLRGFGRSEGLKGDFSSYKAVLNDIRLLENLAIAYAPEIPIFLYGHSMGGNLVLNYGLRGRTTVKAIIASAPYLALTNPKASWLMKTANILNKLCPTLRVSNGINENKLTQLPEVVRDYLADPLVYTKISVRTFLALEAAAGYAMKNASLLQIPTFIYHGTDDMITSPLGSEAFALKNPEFVTYIKIEGGYHELQHDLNAADFRTRVIDLIQSNLR